METKHDNIPAFQSQYDIVEFLYFHGYGALFHGIRLRSLHAFPWFDTYRQKAEVHLDPRYCYVAVQRFSMVEHCYKLLLPWQKSEKAIA